MIGTEQIERVRELRAAGRSPKEIARALGIRPAAAARLVREAARLAVAEAPESAIVGCWVSDGWSAGLTVAADRRQWPDPEREDGEAGLALVSVARRHKPQRSSVCGYLGHLLDVEGALDSPDREGARRGAARAGRGRRFGDASLVAIGLLGEGRVLLRGGRVPQGMALLGEAMLAVVGNIYCHDVPQPAAPGGREALLGRSAGPHRVTSLWLPHRLNAQHARCPDCGARVSTEAGAPAAVCPCGGSTSPRSYL